MVFDAIVIGGGAAGLFCAIQAGKRGRKVLVIEHNAQVGKKILISGGGRCNFTNLDTQAANFISANPHFCKSALARFTPHDFVNLVRKHRIDHYEKKLGQLFCRSSSRSIVDMLLAECAKAGVEIRVGVTVRSIGRNKNFTLSTSQGDFTASDLVIATGGLSYSKVGATGFGYDVARQFGIEVTPMRPSLVALKARTSLGSKLAGISIDAATRAGGQSFRENILFTHNGLSGPAILQASNYWQKNDPIEIDLLPKIEAAELFTANRNSHQKAANFLSELLPRRFVENFAEIPFLDKPMNKLTDKDISSMVESLCHWKVHFSDTEGYDRAEVTLGGVSTDELSSQTMEARKVAGLYFIGEVVDVTGWLGGYNFQWAWASGFAAGISL